MKIKNGWFSPTIKPSNGITTIRLTLSKRATANTTAKVLISIAGDLLKKLDIKAEGSNWSAAFNPKSQRVCVWPDPDGLIAARPWVKGDGINLSVGNFPELPVPKGGYPFRTIPEFQIIPPPIEIPGQLKALLLIPDFAGLLK